MLELLKNHKYIGGRPIYRTRICGRRAHDIEFNTRTNEVRLRLQPGPRKVLDDQGIDPDHLIVLALEWIAQADKKVPCVQNKMVLDHLRTAITWLENRRTDRKERGVEGTWNK